MPLEVVGGSLPVDQFVTKAEKVFETHLKSAPKNPSTKSALSTVSQNKEASSASQPSSVSSTPSAEPVSQQNQEISNRETEPRPGPSEEPYSRDQQGESLDDKVERAKQLIEQRRVGKEESENQETTRKEFDRRHQGQELGKAKRDREERQAQDIVNQIKEDRAKERAHREAVRQQIARDKVEREARRQNDAQERQRAQAASVSPSPTMTDGSERLGKSECISARLQFRLPDGSSLTNSFPADTPLETIRQYIITQLGLSTSSITLYTTYPRRELTEEDLGKSLAELGLAPSSTLIVAVKGSNALTPSGNSSFPELLLWILSPLFTLINFLKAFLFGSQDQSRRNPPPQRTNSSTQSPPSNSGVRHRVPGGVSSIKKEGGIHRLHNRDDEDDDNNTWNGNSTQQM